MLAPPPDTCPKTWSDKKADRVHPGEQHACDLYVGHAQPHVCGICHKKGESSTLRK